MDLGGSEGLGNAAHAVKIMPMYFFTGIISMSRPIIVVGDRTDHGGVVISGSPFSDIDGKQIARIGDKVTCPKKGHGSVTTIVTGDNTAIIDGQPVARHGDKTACGATLLSSQITTYVDTVGGGTARGSTVAAAAGGITASTFAPSSNNTPQEPFNDAFQLVDEQTGEPLANFEYAINRADGKIVYGITDGSGFTQKIGDTSSPENVKFSLGDWEA